MNQFKSLRNSSLQSNEIDIFILFFRLETLIEKQLNTYVCLPIRIQVQLKKSSIIKSLFD